METTNALNRDLAGYLRGNSKFIETAIVLFHSAGEVKALHTGSYAIRQPCSSSSPEFRSSTRH